MLFAERENLISQNYRKYSLQITNLKTPLKLPLYFLCARYDSGRYEGNSSIGSPPWNSILIDVLETET